MTSDGIFLIHCGSRKLYDGDHLRHFVRHLFSSTSGHKPNERTHLNFVSYERYQSLLYNHNKELLKANEIFFNESFQLFSDTEKLRKDLTYAFYFILAKPYVITNMVKINEFNEKEWVIASEDLTEVVKRYYNGSSIAFNDELSVTLKDREVVSIDEFPDHTLEAINNLILAKLEKEYPTNETAITAIHNDEDAPCHIHRIIL